MQDTDIAALRKMKQELEAAISPVGWSDHRGGISDLALDDAVTEVGSMVRLFQCRIDSYWISGPPEAVNLDRAVQVMTGLDRSVSALSMLLSMYRDRKAYVEGQGIAWDDHIDRLLQLKDVMQEISEAREAERRGKAA